MDIGILYSECQKMSHKLKDDKLRKIFEKCFMSTYETTLEFPADGSSYVFTGDIPAMWLRDSSAQVFHYLDLCSSLPELKKVIKGLLRRQFDYILADPYANSFNKNPTGEGYNDVFPCGPLVWERKFEVDSLCYPIWLAYHYYQRTNDTSVFDEKFEETVSLILSIFQIEQHHETQSKYRFMRENCSVTDTLPREGLGSVTAYTGMIWSGFRPSDDRCVYHYLIPANQFAVVILRYIRDIFSSVTSNKPLFEKASAMIREVQTGIDTYGIAEHKKYGLIYAYETDGLGNHLFIDDANVPSLLSLPYLGYCSPEDKIYQNTRRFILSDENPYYFKGKHAEGIGSPHTPESYIWPISLCMQALTSIDGQEKQALIDTLISCDADTFCMHESFHCDNPRQYTREWFAWANSLFAYMIIEIYGLLN